MLRCKKKEMSATHRHHIDPNILSGSGAPEVSSALESSCPQLAEFTSEDRKPTTDSEKLKIADTSLLTLTNESSEPTGTNIASYLGQDPQDLEMSVGDSIRFTRPPPLNCPNPVFF